MIYCILNEKKHISEHVLLWLYIIISQSSAGLIFSAFLKEKVSVRDICENHAAALFNCLFYATFGKFSLFQCQKSFFRSENQILFIVSMCVKFKALNSPGFSW